jgi:hypothetical protein
MLITKTSILTGERNTMDIDITEEQLVLWLDGALIQNVMPNLLPSEREFMITGVTPEEWEKFAKEEGE